MAEKKAAKEAKKERRRENLKKAEENRKKSEIVQVVSENTILYILMSFGKHVMSNLITM